MCPNRHMNETFDAAQIFFSQWIENGNGRQVDKLTFLENETLN